MTLNDPRILHLFLGDILNHLSHLGSIPGLGRSPGGEHGNSLQYSSMEDPHGQRSLVGYSPWGHKELDMTEQLSTIKMESEASGWKVPFSRPQRWKIAERKAQIHLTANFRWPSE